PADDHQRRRQDATSGGDHSHGCRRQAGFCAFAHYHGRGPGSALMSFADRLQRAWYRGHPLLGLLTPLEALYRRVATARRQRFLAGGVDSYRAPVPVIVVGNITVGGTGKTPLILWLIEHCRS